MTDVRGEIADLIEGPKRDMVAQASTGDANASPAKPPPKKVPVDFDIHTWAGQYRSKSGPADSRLRQFAGNASDFLAELQTDVGVKDIAGLVEAVHEKMREARREAAPGEEPYLRNLQLEGHGRSGSMSGILRVGLKKKDRDKLSALKPYFDKDSEVILYGCEVAQGYMGEALLQQMADVWGVTVSGTTGVRHAVFPANAGYEIKRKPGQKLETIQAVVARQIIGELREDDSIIDLLGNVHGVGVTRLGRIIHHVESVSRIHSNNGVINEFPDVRKILEKEGMFDELVETLSDEDIADDEALRQRVRALNIPEVNAELAKKHASQEPTEPETEN